MRDNTNSTHNSSPALLFEFGDASITAFSRDGEAWFVASEVATALGYTNTRDAIAKHCKAAENCNSRDLRLLGIPCSSPRGLSIIPERDLYRLIMRSKLKAAEAFEEKVVSEILPSIRKHGGYMVADAQETPEQLALRAMQVLQSTVERQKVQITSMQDDVDVLARIAKADGSLCVTEAAKVLGVRPKSLFDYLYRNKWIYRRNGSGNWLGFAYHCTAGDLEHRVRTEQKPDGSEIIREQVRITPQGMTKLAKIFLKEGVAAHA